MPNSVFDYEIIHTADVLKEEICVNQKKDNKNKSEYNLSDLVDMINRKIPIFSLKLQEDDENNFIRNNSSVINFIFLSLSRMAASCEMKIKTDANKKQIILFKEVEDGITINIYLKKNPCG